MNTTMCNITLNTDDTDDFGFEETEKRFPKAKFFICIPFSSLDDVLSDSDSIVIVIEHKCYCYSENPKKDDRIVVRNKSGYGITYGDAIQALVDRRYKPCAHPFLEDFYENSQNSNVFRAIFGS